MELFYEGILIGVAVGVLSVMLIMPVLQQISSVLVNALEVINGYTTRSVTRKNADIQIIQAEMEDKIQPVATSAIGFEAPTSEYIYGDECNCSDKSNVGFH